jgi:hypothetical protein
MPHDASRAGQGSPPRSAPLAVPNFAAEACRNHLCLAWLAKRLALSISIFGHYPIVTNGADIQGTARPETGRKDVPLRWLDGA